MSIGGEVLYSFTETISCRTDVWARKLPTSADFKSIEITYQVRETGGGAVTACDVIVYNDANRDGKIDPEDRILSEYHLPYGQSIASVRYGPAVVTWRVTDAPYPYLLRTYEVNHSTKGRNLTALYDVMAATQPATSQP